MYHQKMEADTLRSHLHNAGSLQFTGDALLCHIFDVTKPMSRRYLYMGFEVLIVVLMMFWDMLSCQLVYS